jgi:hypothetical protein
MTSVDPVEIRTSAEVRALSAATFSKLSTDCLTSPHLYDPTRFQLLQANLDDNFSIYSRHE